MKPIIIYFKRSVSPKLKIHNINKKFKKSFLSFILLTCVCVNKEHLSHYVLCI